MAEECEGADVGGGIVMRASSLAILLLIALAIGIGTYLDFIDGNMARGLLDILFGGVILSILKTILDCSDGLSQEVSR